MEKTTTFKISAELIDGIAFAEDGDYKNPLLTFVQLVFTDDKPNKNNQGVPQSEFDNLIRSMAYMPIKAEFDEKQGFGGHDDAIQVGVIKGGQQQGNKVVAVGALYNDEFPDVVEFFKNEFASKKPVEFSWELRYTYSDTDKDIEWLRGLTTKAITAVSNPAYDGRTQLISLSSLIESIDKELEVRQSKDVLLGV